MVGLTARQQPDTSWFRWALVPTSFAKVVRDDTYALSLGFREPISPLPDRTESFHSAPGADPAEYRESRRVMLTYPIGRLFTVARSELMESYRTAAGLTVVRHYTLNEDDHDRAKGPSNLPFDGQVGYIAVDTDRAGPLLRLLEARAIAAADPTNLGLPVRLQLFHRFSGLCAQLQPGLSLCPRAPIHHPERCVERPGSGGAPDSHAPPGNLFPGGQHLDETQEGCDSPSPRTACCA